MMTTDEKINDPQYQVWTTQINVPKSWEGGFAEGYRTAWLDCWEYFTELSKAEVKNAAENAKDSAPG